MPSPPVHPVPTPPPSETRQPSLLWKVHEDEAVPAAPLRIPKEAPQTLTLLQHLAAQEHQQPPQRHTPVELLRILKQKLQKQEILERWGLIKSKTPPMQPSSPQTDLDADAAADELLDAIKRSASRPNHRPVKGQVTLKGVATGAKTAPAVLSLSAAGKLSLVGGAELHQTLLSIPFSHVLLELVPDHDNCIHLKANKEHDDTAGVIIVLPTRSIRDLWLSTSSHMGIRIDNWSASPDMSRDWTPERPLCATGTLPLVRWLS